LIVTSVAPRLLGTPRGAGPIDPTDPPAEHVEELKHAAAFLAGKNLQPELVPAFGEPADTIVEVAEQRGADLIVVGTREPNVLERLLGQSVSQTVSRHAHCDVLIVH
jgi:nucleotide-binding universal stress UspA family protein